MKNSFYKHTYPFKWLNRLILHKPTFLQKSVRQTVQDEFTKNHIIFQLWLLCISKKEEEEKWR